MSTIPAEYLQACYLCLLTTMIMYVVDWIADQRERRRYYDLQNGVNKNSK